MITKVCTSCQETKPATNFQKRSRKCYRCLYAKEREQRLLRARSKPNTYRRTPEGRLLYKYGITLEERDQMIANQSHQCAICKEPFDLSKPRSANVDHCHNTGRIRGILCRDCNCMIGLARDSVTTLNAAISYLEKEGKNL